MGAYCLLFAIDWGWLDQSGDCVDGGDDPGYEGMAFYTTALDDRCDVPPVDIGYHYPRIVRFVDGGAAAGGDGRNWGTAYQYLQDALYEAVGGGIDAVCVAEGTYTPDSTRSSSFVLVDNLALYGGFADNEADFDFDYDINSRNLGTDKTILSGEIGTAALTDNCYHVVTGADKTMLDGFTITKGYADHASTPQYQRGGGMYNSYSPAVTNCIFDDNYALYGGGMFNDESTPTVTGCSFTDNEAYYSGGGLYCLSSGFDFNLTNCLFRDNVATSGSGGAIFFETSAQPIDVENCTFSQNSADSGDGGAIYSHNSHPNVVNSILWDNSDSTANNYDIVAYGDSLNLSYSNYSEIDWDNLTFGSSNCIQTDPQFADPDNDDFHLKSKDGRWDPDTQSWDTTDTVYSKCLAHAHPSLTYSNEPTPNGGKINMGAYGNTSEASKVNSDNLGRLRASVYISGAPPVVGPYDAQWRLSYEQDGTWHSPYNTGSFTMEGLVPASGYYVVFKDVSGYTTPELSPYGPFIISEGGLAVVGGFYAEE